MDANHYPLSWPFGWRRTPADERGRSSFTEATIVTRTRWTGSGHETNTSRGTKRITVPTACTRLLDQVERLGGSDPILSTNVEPTIYGLPKGGRAEPSDPGAAVYFKLQGKDRVLACDRWVTVAENIAALAAHIDAIRRVDRYGVGTMEQAFAGYDALPPPSTDNRAPWRATLGFRPDSRVTVADVNLNYRTLAKKDPNNEYRLLDLNLAREAALQELGANGKTRTEGSTGDP